MWMAIFYLGSFSYRPAAATNQQKEKSLLDKKHLNN